MSTHLGRLVHVRKRMHGALSVVRRGDPLGRCDQVGTGAEVRGTPDIENYGRIDIGDRFRLDCSVVRTHLVTAPAGVLMIGHDVSVGFGVGITAQTRVDIGDRTRIGPYVMIMDTDFHTVGQHNLSSVGEPIRIGDDVLIGPNVTVLKGATIGPGATILAGSVVTGFVRAGAVVGGVPAREQLAGSASTTHLGASQADQVLRVLRTTFALSADPDLMTHPRDIPGWNSLGTLKLILALEDDLGVALDEQDMFTLNSVQDLIDVVAMATGRLTAAGATGSR